MNTSNLKKYAPRARREFMDAVTRRLNLFGISADKKGHLQISEPVISGSVMQIDGNSFDSQLARPRNRLVERCETLGLQQLVEQVAYTWFNRLCAIRFMELHDYLGHGLRVLSHPAAEKGFEILDHAQDAAAELGLDRNHVIELKLAGNKDEQLYRELLLGQCHQLHQAMPFLFEALDDDTELLLPDNLTRTDSILRGLVDSVPEADWQQVEVIGWLYQFYISEKKDQVIGKVVKSEDIPAATQLFTPNWIVKYLVQNSVGRQWLQTYPDSAIKSQMEYYIEPAEQTPEVVEQLKAITPDAIDPETITVLDPACGSGHILIEAYNVLKAIYEERGYRSRDIPQLILEKNLFGLDIDDRAAQLAGFALMMMAREDDKRIFSRNVKLNVLSLQECAGIDLAIKWQALNLSGDWQTGASQGMFSDSQQELSSANADHRFKLLQTTLARFTEAKTFGSLIEVPAEDLDGLKDLLATLSELVENGDSMQKPAAKRLMPFVHQAMLLAQRYDAVVANPPYMGSKGMNAALKEFAKKQYPNSKSDLFAIFMEHAFSLLNDNGFNAQVNMQSWMFLSSYEKLREWLLDTKTFVTMAHLGARAFSQISGEVVQTTAWIIGKKHLEHYQPVFFRLIEGAEETKKMALQNQESKFDSTQQDDFKKIPGSPIAYWVSNNLMSAFSNKKLRNVADGKQGMATSDNDRFLRLWYEVDFNKTCFDCVSNEESRSKCEKWYAYNKGGSFRRWYGNNEYLVNWQNGGRELKDFVNELNKLRPGGRLKNQEYYFLENITYSSLSSGLFSARYNQPGFLFDTKGSCIFPKSINIFDLIALLNSKVAQESLNILCPTLDYSSIGINSLPVITQKGQVAKIAKELIQLSKLDWDSYETSWDFNCSTLVRNELGANFLSDAYKRSREQWRENVQVMKSLEEENNKIQIKLFNLTDELNSSVPNDEVTLKRNPSFCYGNDVADEKMELLMQSDVLSEFVSYSLGCMMGRYSLDREGLIYAHAANEGFTDLVAEGAYQTFPADDDGIIPLTDQEWFKDDATNRFREFVKTVWGEEHLQENLDFVAESLCLHAIKPKKGEAALAAIRRYLSSQFYKDHLKTYKKRPIYWLFSSGKQKAFECLVYLHRYNEGTLARMRTEYVTPLLGKYDAYLDQLQNQIDHASSTSDANRLKKEQAALSKKQVELRSFDDKLKHYADRRIALDLDDGVKVNYGKFGDLLSDVKAITGHAPENN